MMMMEMMMMMMMMVMMMMLMMMRGKRCVVMVIRMIKVRFGLADAICSMQYSVAIYQRSNHMQYSYKNLNP